MFSTNKAPSLISQVKEKASSFFGSLATSSASFFSRGCRSKDSEYRAAMRVYDTLLQDTLNLFNEIDSADVHFAEKRCQIDTGIQNVKSKHSMFFETKKSVEQKTKVESEEANLVVKLTEISGELSKLRQDFPDLPVQPGKEEIYRLCADIEERLANIKALYAEYFSVMNEFQRLAFDTIEKCGKVQGVVL